MLETILYYATMWGPAIVSILGIATTVIVAIGKVINAIGEWKVAKENETTVSNKLHADMQTLVNENKKLQLYNQKLLEHITKIAGYNIEVNNEQNNS